MQLAEATALHCIALIPEALRTLKYVWREIPKKQRMAKFDRNHRLPWCEARIAAWLGRYDSSHGPSTC